MDTPFWQAWTTRRDAQAFQQIVTSYAPMIYATCMRILRNETDAEDVAQECFEVLAKTRRGPKETMGAWLHAVATNRALNKIREDKRRRDREERFGALQKLRDEVSWDDIYDFVDEAIAALPDKYRAPIIAHFLEGKSQTEVARAMDLSARTASYRIGRGVELIGESLRKRGVTLGLTVLAGMLTAHMATAAEAPSALTAALGKLALAHSGNAVAAGGTSASLSALCVSKLAAIAAMIVIIAAGVVVTVKVWDRNKPSAPVSMPSIAASVSSPETKPADDAPTAVQAKPDAAERASAATANATGNPAIKGRVYDIDTGRGIPNVMVVVDDNLHTNTNATGSYRIEGLPPEHYAVRVYERASGALDEYYQPVPTQHELNVEQGGVYDGIDFTLKKGVTLTGIVVDESGQPVADAYVGGYANDPEWRKDVRSIANGSFVVRGAPPRMDLLLYAEKKIGDFIARTGENGGEGTHFSTLQGGIDDIMLVVHLQGVLRGSVQNREGHPIAYGCVAIKESATGNLRSQDIKPDGSFQLSIEPGTYLLGFALDSRSGPGEGTSVEVKSGEVSDVILTADVAAKQTGLTISGHVRNREGQPLGEVSLSAAGERGDYGNEWRCETDRNGAYTIENLLEGSYVVCAYPPSFGSNALEYTFELKKGVAAGSAGVDLVLERPAKVEGTVTFAGTNAPVTDYKIVYDIARAREREFNIHDSAGHYEIDNLPFCNLEPVATITVTANGMAPASKQVTVMSSDDGVATADFTLAPGARVQGFVTDYAGTPVRGADIFLNEIPQHSARLYEKAHVAMSAADGTFAIESLTPDKYTFIAREATMGIASESLDVKPGQTHQLTLRLGAAGSVHGIVTFEGRPLGGANVRISAFVPREDKGRVDANAFTEPDGSYKFAGFPQPGKRNGVTASIDQSTLPGTLSGYTAFEMTMHQQIQTVSSEKTGEEIEINFPFPFGTAALEGYLTRDEEVLKNTRFAVVGQMSDTVNWSIDSATDTEGHYQVAGLPGGAVSFVLRQEYDPTNIPAQAAEGQTLTCDIDFSEAGEN